MSEHLLAGRHIWGPPSRILEESSVTWCTCGLSFFSHEGREGADRLWRVHLKQVDESIDEPED